MEQWRLDGMKVTRNAEGKEFNIKYGFFTDGITHDVYAAAETIQCPVLIIHGHTDDLVPLAQSRELLTHLKGEKTLHIMEGANHYFGTPAHFQELISSTLLFLEDKV